MSHTLTTYDRKLDRVLFLNTHPPLNTISALVGQIAKRRMDSEGKALALRFLRACLAASTDLLPDADSPRAHAAAYGRVRTAIYNAMLGVQALAATGVWRPTISLQANAAMERILALDATVAPPGDRIPDLIIMVSDFTWVKTQKTVIV
jgi:hypothetical protein